MDDKDSEYGFGGASPLHLKPKGVKPTSQISQYSPEKSIHRPPVTLKLRPQETEIVT